MFKLAGKRIVKWPVTVSIPQDGGKTMRATFTAEFEVLSQDELQAMIGAGDDIASRVLVGWAGVNNEDGTEPIVFSDEAKKQLLGITYARTAVLAAYFEVSSGKEAARKN